MYLSPSHSLLTEIRVLYTRLYILRPIVLEEVILCSSAKQQQRAVGIQATATKMAEQRLQDVLCKLCVETAHEVLEELHHSLTGRRRISPWHALFCMILFCYF
jgi:hypothetical protein